MKAVFVLSLFLFVAALAADTSDQEDDFKCKVGVYYQENKCNTCWCETYGLACHMMACKSHEDPKLVNCEKGTTWKEDCEQCWCTVGGTICTTNCGKVREMHRN
ncbi:hypothetical protein ILUMI_20189 [Ignelater luminosus]|uniref:Protease inhibitor n=1 Tax=Ignelater luminosus TaxID=2038154 RepID=A0A8K0CER4_IGNLU|nr:hypothetical protein ILUMI_20189 [Ignelater luminosus]